jgi:FixJ family two-component response regulator
MAEEPPTVFIVDDDDSVRKSLGRLLGSAGYRVEVFATADEFQRRPGGEGPGCAVLDVQLPGLGGLELQQALNGGGPRLPVVFITGHGDIPMSVRAMKAGAVDFLPKPFDDGDLLDAVRRAVERSVRDGQDCSELSELRRRADSLSQREREVFAMVVAGLANKQVGHRLGITEKTVKVHRGKVMEKMRAGSLAELVRMAGRLGVGRADG